MENSKKALFSKELLDEIFFVSMDQACFRFGVVNHISGGVEDFAFSAVRNNAVVILQDGSVYRYEHKGKSTGSITWNGDDVYRKEFELTYDVKEKLGKIKLADGNIEDVAFDVLSQVNKFVC